MRAWTAPDLPKLPGRGDTVRLHDTASGQIVATEPAGRARLYVCGITPYDATHLGHAATYLAFDQLIRTWHDAGHDVVYVQNVTDVDDPLLERATATGVDWVELAEQQTDLFREDMAWLRVLPPQHFIGAVEYIPRIIDLIATLQGTGAVYQVDDDLYFDVRADSAFGSVSGMDAATMASLFAERGGDPDRPGKRDPLDSLLWQAARPGEPAWPSPFGAGRPGWHIECAAIALDHLGTSFDVQGGGNDLIFPHHEMSASGAHVATGEPFAKAYVHAAMIGLDGEKMSKSLGNLVLASALRAEGHAPGAVRLALLAGHYRTDRDWTPALLEQGTDRLRRWQTAVAESGQRDATGLLTVVRERLADDLDTPGALEAIDAWVAGGPVPTAESLPTPEGGEPVQLVDLADALLGVDLRG